MGILRVQSSDLTIEVEAEDNHNNTVQGTLTFPGVDVSGKEFTMKECEGSPKGERFKMTNRGNHSVIEIEF